MEKLKINYDGTDHSYDLTGAITVEHKGITTKDSSIYNSQYMFGNKNDEPASDDTTKAVTIFIKTGAYATIANTPNSLSSEYPTDSDGRWNELTKAMRDGSYNAITLQQNHFEVFDFDTNGNTNEKTNYHSGYLLLHK